MFGKFNDSCCCCCCSCVNLRPIYKRICIPKWVCYKPVILDDCNCGNDSCCGSGFDNGYNNGWDNQ